MIHGLESDYYCVHNPIPVEVRAEIAEGESISMNLKIDGVDVFPNAPVFYTIFREGAENVYKINLSEWVKQVMVRFEEIYGYTSEIIYHPDPYLKEVTIVFTGNGYEEETTKHFLHCVVNDFGEYESDCVKAWKCYPFSTIDSRHDRVYFVPTEDDFPSDVDMCESVDYDTTCCNGTYLKWLNHKGYYYYWLFPNVASQERESEEILRLPRSVFDPNQSSNEDTSGFEGKENIILRDKVHYAFWPMFKSLVISPEVYVLRHDWELGTNAAVDDWVKVIQDKPKFQADNKNNTAEFEVSLLLPKLYTQKMI